MIDRAKLETFLSEQDQAAESLKVISCLERIESILASRLPEPSEIQAVQESAAMAEASIAIAEAAQAAESASEAAQESAQAAESLEATVEALAVAEVVEAAQESEESENGEDLPEVETVLEPLEEPMPTQTRKGFLSSLMGF